MKILSRDYIEHIAERILKVYYQLPEFQGRKVYSIDPEIVIRKVLGLEIEYAHLSLNGNILGMTSFNDIDVEVYEQDDQDKFVNLDGNPSEESSCILKQSALNLSFLALLYAKP